MVHLSIRYWSTGNSWALYTILVEHAYFWQIWAHFTLAPWKLELRVKKVSPDTPDTATPATFSKFEGGRDLTGIGGYCLFPGRLPCRRRGAEKCSQFRSKVFAPLVHTAFGWWNNWVQADSLATLHAYHFSYFKLWTKLDETLRIRLCKVLKKTNITEW